MRGSDSTIGARRRLLWSLVGALMTSALLAGPALAQTTQTTYTWTGAGTFPTTWSQSVNWDSNGVPSSSLTGTDLSFPALTGAACTTSPQTATCYTSVDDLGALSVNSLTIEDGLGYSLTAAGSSDTITLGAGGLTAAPSASDPAQSVGARIDIPIMLGANQSWSITGGTSNQQVALEQPVTGTADTLGIALNGQTFLGLTGDNEVGAVTVTASGTPGTLALDSPGSLGILNGTDANPVTLDNGTGLFADPGETGPLTVNAGTVQIGQGVTSPGDNLLTVKGAVSLSSSSTLDLSVNDGSGTTAGEDYSQLSATGNVALGGASLLLSNFSACPTLTVGQVYTLVQTSGGTVSGTFAGLANGSDFQLNCFSGTPPTFQIGYTTTSVTATVVPAVTTMTSVSAAPSAPVTDQPVTLTATVTPASSSPTGTVEFYDGGTPISGCTNQPVAQTGPSLYTATCTAAFPAAASPLSLTATFTSTNPAVAGSTSTAASLSVLPATTTVGLQTSSSAPLVGQTVTYTATVVPAVSGSVAPTGTVEFLDGGSAIGGCGAQPVTGDVATCSVAYGTPGAQAVSAQYSGDANFDGSTSPVVSVTASAPTTPPPTTTTPPPTTTTPPPTTSAGGGSAVVGRAAAPRVRGTALFEPLSCSGPSTRRCAFKLTLTVLETFRGRRLVGVSARASHRRIRPRRRTVTVGIRAVSLTGGSSEPVKIALNPLGRRLLRTRRTLPVKLTVVAVGRTVRHQAVRFRQPTAKRRKRLAAQRVG